MAGAAGRVTAADAALSIDRSSPVPLYFQVAQWIEQSIRSGHYQPGDRIDNENALAARLGVSRPTVRSAIAHLADSGMLVTRRGIGTLVAPPRITRPIALTSLYDDLREAGLAPQTRLLSFDRATASPEVAHELGIQPGDPVVTFTRLRSAGGPPIALLTNYVSPDRISLDEEQLRDSDGFYRLLRASGVRLRSASQTIAARKSTRSESARLACSVGDPVLTMKRTAFDDEGRAVEHGCHVYPADRYAFHMGLLAR